MVEVHEITRTAFEQIAHRIIDYRDFSDIEWVAVDCWSWFGEYPNWVHLHINRGLKTLEEAQKHADFWNGRITEGFWCEGEYFGPHVEESEIWHIVDDEPRTEPDPDRYGLYQRYALEAYLGDFAEEYDIDAIEDAVTVLDYSTGNRYWTMDDDELAEYIAGL